MFSGIRRPLREALKVLARHAESISAEWTRSLENLSLHEHQVEALTSLRMSSLRPVLETGQYDNFKLALEEFGRNLEKSGLAADDILCALSSCLASCLPFFGGPAAGAKGMRVALLRLYSASQRFIFQGYTQKLMEASRRADEQEKHKLSRDLHDDIGHSLVVLKLYIEMIAKDLREGNTLQVERKLEEAKDLIGDSVDSVRRLILDLGPAILDEAGIIPAIQLYSRQFQVRTGIRVQVRAGDMPARLPPGHETAIYRLYQGALSNVVKHSHAKNVRVTLGGVGKGTLVLKIEDDGAGFDATRLKHRSGFGLKAMRDRIESLGGRFHVESRPAKFGERQRGTRIEVDLPLPPDETK